MLIGRRAVDFHRRCEQWDGDRVEYLKETSRGKRRDREGVRRKNRQGFTCFERDRG